MRSHTARWSLGMPSPFYWTTDELLSVALIAFHLGAVVVGVLSYFYWRRRAAAAGDSSRRRCVYCSPPARAVFDSFKSERSHIEATPPARAAEREGAIYATND